MSNYSELLKDPRWQKKRLKILERDDFTCQRCKSTEKTLHVHHFKYSGNPWEADDGCLITLCEDCHEFEERVKHDLSDIMKDVCRENSILMADYGSLIHASYTYIMAQSNISKRQAFLDVVERIKVLTNG